MTDLAKKLSTSPQAISRHLSRLEEAKIIEKESDTCFGLTPFGKVLLVLIPSFRFVTQYKEFFLSHDITAIPVEFSERIGELENAVFEEGVGQALKHIANIIRNAEEYFWIASDKVIGFAKQTNKDVRTNVPFKVVRTAAGYDASLEISGQTDDQVQVRLTESVNVGIAMNEKKAEIVFSDLNSQVDYGSSFISDDPTFHKWCSDLFIFYWNNAKPRIK